MPEKNAAAVSLGKRRQAAMTPEERKAFQAAGVNAALKSTAARPPEERRRISRKAAATVRANRPWLTMAPPAELPAAAELPAELPPAELAAAIHELPDEVLEELYSALIERFGV